MPKPNARRPILSVKKLALVTEKSALLEKIGNACCGAFSHCVFSPVLLLFYSALNTGGKVFPENAYKIIIIKPIFLLTVLARHLGIKLGVVCVAWAVCNV